MRKQNVGVQIMYKSGGASPNSFCLEKSALAGFSQTSLMFSSRCCPLLMQSQSLRLPLAAPLLWADSLPHCTGSFVPAPHAEMSQILAFTKYRRPPRFHWFSPNFSCQYLCSQASYQKLVKANSNHHHCPISVFLPLTSIQRPLQRSSVWAQNCPNGGGGRRASILIRSRWGGAASKHASHLL